jgi:endonuclease YncB( thermonuclease family)
VQAVGRRSGEGMSRTSAVLFYLAGAATTFAVINTVGVREKLAEETAEASTPSAGLEHYEGTIPIVDAGKEFTCTPDRVWDGDGPLWCKEGPRIRVAGIAAREIDGTCRSNQPCPSGSATAARDHLADLVGKRIGESPDGHILVSGAALDCFSEGNGKGTRTAAWCRTKAGVDLSCAMVDSGLALKWDRYWHNHRCA